MLADKLKSGGNEKYMTKRNKLKVLVIYLTAFFVLWSLNEIILFEKLNLLIKNEVLFQFVKDALVKNLVWTLPAILLIHHFKLDVSVSLKEMFSFKINWLKYLPLFILFTLYLLGGAILQNGKLEISSNFGLDDIIVFLFVGITEELVFRGWLLNITISEDKKWRYIFINAIMFLAIHFPIWIQEGVFISNFTSFGFLSILILSILFSCIFVKSKNILVPVALHMYWDLLVIMFY